MSEKKDHCEREMLGALAAGVVLGSAIAFTILSYLWEWEVVKGARWWEVMTAFGTVMSAGLALWFWFYQRKKDFFHQRALAKVKAARLAIAMRGPTKQISELLGIAAELRKYYGAPLFWLGNRPKFERLLEKIQPFYTDEDCEAFYPVHPEVAGWLSVSLGCYERLKDKNLLITDSEALNYTKENLRIIGVALQTIHDNIERCRIEFSKLREEFSMDSSASTEWLEWNKKLK
ncbi:hypothetical protein [Alcaligenes aquatilis]|uniref:hypothetical protein n=1 Tax=Alcaligenes aquatilis TaxID=323284 RepID=UPI00362242F2